MKEKLDFGYFDFIGLSDQDQRLKQKPFEEIVETFPLYFDYLTFLEKSTDKPWLDKEKYVPILLNKWEKVEPEITAMFQQRNRRLASLPMKKMILLFLAFLFWTNDKPVTALDCLKEQVRDLKFKPVNVEERLAYLLQAPDHHHAFTQLKQLIIEQRKKYAIATMKKG